MSLPPGFLDELRARISLAQVVGRKVMWDTRKSNQGKGDWWAPCPFHQEKTASFHVDDRKGYYYCFGCHQKGDAISFVRETENVDFMEAVEILAREAGMQMPARDPGAREAADRHAQLVEVTEQAVRHYRLQLRTAAGTEAREYLARRGLSDDAIDRWEIGFAAPGWQGLWDHLTGKGVAPDLILGAGLARPSDKGRQPYDVFRNRIMFPIRDARGRAVAFGGRAMDPGESAKYLNTPETDLFDKGRMLYNHGPAREAAGKGGPLVVAEGYMDVIALSEAGFRATVAPLGTAVTPEQLAHMWRISPEPVIALDGDRAGLAAAMRVMDLALPRMVAGQSLRFALMPEGRDPDDVIRAGGPKAMESLLDDALPMVTLLWRRETEGRTFDSPERRATLDKALRERIRAVGDHSLRRHYAEEIDALRREIFRRPGPPVSRGSRGGRGRQPFPAAPHSATRSSLLATAEDDAADRLREAVILATFVVHSELVEAFEGELEAMELAGPGHDKLRQALLRHGPDGGREEVEAAVGTEILENIFAHRHVQIAPGVRDAADREKARLCVAEEIAKLAAARGARRDVEEAVTDFSDLADEGLTWRLSQAAAARDRATRSGQEDKTDYETADNGARIARAERDAFESILSRIDPTKGGKRLPGRE